MPERFSEEIVEAIGNYVYRLIDPRNGETFYVGKGKGNRVFDHAAGVIAVTEEEDGFSQKQQRIKEILNANLEVIHVIHRHEIPDSAVFEVEAALIDAYPGLSNVQGGHDSNTKGPMNHREIILKFARPNMEMAPSEKLILININDVEDRSRQNVYDQVRYAWRLSVERAKQADYVLAVVRGVVIGVFIAEDWKKASRDNFPELARATDAAGLTRYGFKGRPADEAAWERFVGETGKRVVNEDMKHVQNPVRYWRI